MAELASIEAHTEDSPNRPDIGQVVAIQRPDYVPEKFYDSKTGVINFEAMARSYGEIEKMKSAAPAPKADEVVAGKETPAPAAAAPKPVEIPTIPGVKPESITAFTAELNTAGKLSDKSYTELLAAGYNKATVDSYIKGLQADATVEAATTQAVAEARVADEQIKEITDSIGGKTALKEMQDWAKASLSEKDLAAYNAAVSGSDPAKVKLAVHGLHAQFAKANGTSERLIDGQNNVGDSVDVFHSRAEQTAAINDPRYGKDEAYRARVAAKMGRSNI